jgi:hypothetical protein
MDLPMLHGRTKEGKKFIEALSKTEDMSLFHSFPVQAIINKQWNLSKYWTYCFILIPFFVMLTMFTYWSYAFVALEKFGPDEAETYRISSYLQYFCIYFILFELIALVKDFKYYIKRIWNFVEIIPMFLVYYSAYWITQKGFKANSSYYNIQAYSALLMWIKLMNYLRYFKSTSYLIHSLIEIMMDIVPFGMVVTVAIFGFGDAWQNISHSYDGLYGRGDANTTPYQQFATGPIEALRYSYLFFLGTFDFEVYD